MPAYTLKRIADSLFETQSAGYLGSGGAIYFTGGGTLDVENTTFRNCSAIRTGNGGAIAVLGTNSRLSNVTIVDTLFEENLAGVGVNSAMGGAVYASGSSVNVSASRSTFVGNYAGYVPVSQGPSGYGGAIAAGFEATVRVSECVFSHNAAGATQNGAAGGAISSNGNAFVLVEGSVFANNTAPFGNGGALSANFAMISVSNCSFVNNTSPAPAQQFGLYGTGAAIGTSRNALVNISNSSFIANAAGGIYGAIALNPIGNLNSIQLRVEGCSFEGNTAAEPNATAIWVPDTFFNVEGCGSANAFANEPVAQTTLPSPLPPCA